MQSTPRITAPRPRELRAPAPLMNKKPARPPHRARSSSLTNRNSRAYLLCSLGRARFFAALLGAPFFAHCVSARREEGREVLRQGYCRNFFVFYAVIPGAVFFFTTKWFTSVRRGDEHFEFGNLDTSWTEVFPCCTVLEDRTAYLMGFQVGRKN